jgi:glycosyltransferase involved in cell wall biosynthesis
VRKIRVLELIDKPFLGGGQVHLLSLAKGLDKTRYDIAVAAGGGGPLEGETKRAGLDFVAVPVGKKLGRAAVRAIAGVLDERRVDILHTHGGVAGLFGRRAASAAKTPVVVHTLHGIHYLHYRNPVLRELLVLQERHFARTTDAVIFVSEADAAAGRRHRLVPEQKIRVIRNGVDFAALPDPAKIRPALDRLASELHLSFPVVGTVARLHRQKGVIHLLNAAPEILGRFPDAAVVVVGGGPEEPRLRAAVSAARLEGRVFLLGERSEARDIMTLFDVFVLPSLWEGLPLALLEASALGKAIVATDIEGVREVLENNRTGLLVPPKDPAALAAAAVRLIGDRGFAATLGAAAKAAIPPRFTLESMLEAVDRLYCELAEKKLR